MRGSKNTALPRSILAGVMGLFLTAGVVDGSGEKMSSARAHRSASAWAAPTKGRAATEAGRISHRIDMESIFRLARFRSAPTEIPAREP